MKKSSILFAITVLVGTLSTLGASPTGAATPLAIPGCTIEQPESAFANEVHVSGRRAQVWRLYQAIFLRQPDRAGFDYWAGISISGASLDTIAIYFTTESKEFINLYSNVSNYEFVQLVYRNVFCREPDNEGLNYWAGLLDDGVLTRPQVAIQFSESKEYLQSTQTCHSVGGGGPNSELQHCLDVSEPVPLAQATLAANGYEASVVQVQTTRSYPSTWTGSRTGEGTAVSGTITGTIADIRKVSTSMQRCDISSVNSNWLTPGTKDTASPTSIGWGVVDGVVIKTTGDGGDRGVLGMVPKASNPQGLEMRDGNKILQGYSILDTEDHYLLTRVDDRTDAANYQWSWAVGGITTIFNGDFSVNFNVVAWADSYTMNAGTGQSFAAVDRDTGRVFFGTAKGLHAYDLHKWLLDNGYDNAFKFDGGGSTEYNVGGQAVVTGTSRHPMWFGVGC